MTCLECRNLVPAGEVRCPSCGAPVEVSVAEVSEFQPVKDCISRIMNRLTTAPSSLQGSDTTAQNKWRPRLWNPWLLVLFELPFFGSLVASVLVALNWRELKQTRWVVASCCFLPISWVLISYVLKDASLLQYLLHAFVLWFIVLALPQIWYVRTYFAEGFEKRRWIIPIGVGLVLQFILPSVLAVAEEFVGRFENSVTDPNLALTTAEPVQEVNLTVQEVAEKKSGLVFAVECRWEEPAYIFFTENNSRMGSCVLIGVAPGANYFVTNRHVVHTPSSAKNIKRLMGSGDGKQPFEIVAYGKEDRDLALLKVVTDYKGPDLATDCRTLEEIAVGEDCIAIGNALGEGISVTTGTISRFDVIKEKNLVLIRTSAPISPGNSGGGLFRRKDGCLIGITTSTMDRERVQNMNFAIPTNYLLEPDAWDKVSTHSP